MNTKFNLFENIDINFNFNISFWTVSTITLIGIFVFYIKNPEKFEKLISLIAKFLNFLTHKFDKTYIKFDLQGKINSYVKDVKKRTKHLSVDGVKIQWLESENVTPDNYIKSGNLIIRLHKSENQNKNIVNASMAFVSNAFLKKAKSYIAKYQRESIDIYTCYDLLRNEKSEILDQFVQDFMKEKMDNDKIADLFEKYEDINKAGIYYPILIQELTFLGEKVFARKRDANIIYEEVKQLIYYLYNYANRKYREDVISDFNGNYCKFAIRIIGKIYKVSEGEQVYIRNLRKINSSNETLYLIGNVSNKNFIKKVVAQCKDEIGYDIISEENYHAIIKDDKGNDYSINNYLLILRSKKIQVYHKL
ncbi:hypothetical protein DXC07_04355 [Bacteroides uniformis]|uniref:Uncharacterized protein n=1 Tax=Bacteroides uniformis TaxID=820 RepID=A0A3E4XQJ7_BACUN|nr:hypothetical protein [Bacteroides uniformis]RGM58014.1 hypothetical protein DXC07_04355 [Bacteroides uniformis]